MLSRFHHSDAINLMTRLFICFTWYSCEAAPLNDQSSGFNRSARICQLFVFRVLLFHAIIRPYSSDATRLGHVHPGTIGLNWQTNFSRHGVQSFGSSLRIRLARVPDHPINREVHRAVRAHRILSNPALTDRMRSKQLDP